MALKRLLVNADDFGLSQAINRGIIRSHREGIVRSTSMVAAGLAFDDAASLAASNPQLGIGAHLTLVEEAAVAADIPTLAPNGQLPQTYGRLIKGVAAGKIRLSDIEREFRAQIEKCLRHGLKLTHLDSHQHTHTFPQIFKLAVRLANEYGIGGIRIPRDVPHWRFRKADRFLPKCALCLLAHSDAILIPRRETAATEHFAGLFETGDLTEAALLNILENLSDGTTELVCHPGKEETSERYGKWNQRRQVEMASLTSQRVREKIAALGIELISYRELAATDVPSTHPEK